MDIKVYGPVGNIIEKVESGSTIIGNDNRTISIDWSNKETYMRLEKELEEIKKALESKSHEEEVKIVEEALLAVKDVDESKFMKAVKCMGTRVEMAVWKNVIRFSIIYWLRT